MYIRTIIEDTLDKKYPYLKNEHGLSLYINYNNKNILFDSGPSSTLLENSKSLNIDLKEIDYLILSHGHFDHGGGILSFFSVNSKAKVYMNKSCFKDFYYESNSTKEFIGLSPEIFKKYSDRIVFTDNSKFQLTDDIFLVSDITLKKALTYNNKAMLVNQKNNIFSQDYFEHEQIMFVRDNDKTYIFSGCSHSGIINIIHYIKKIFDIKIIDYFIGGLHLVDDPINKTPISNSELDEVANYLNKNVKHTYGCHCTGDPAYNYLRSKLQSKIHYLRTGTEIII